jgi:hypothetical protein
MEFREIIKLPPCLLYAEDLEELERIVSDKEKHENDVLEIKISHNEKTIKYNSINELLNSNNPFESTDSLSISSIGWIKEKDKNIINRTLYLTMHHSFNNLQIFSINEDWYNGKKTRIIRFFKNSKPWYSIINKVSPIFPTISLFFLFYLSVLIKKGEYLLSVIPFLFAVFFILVTILTFKQKIFPYIKIVLRKKSTRILDINKLVVIIGIIQIIIMLLQFLISIPAT